MNNLDEIEKIVQERKNSNLEIFNIIKTLIENSNMNFEGFLIRILGNNELNGLRTSQETLNNIKNNIRKHGY
jgi:hypothetical protein